MRAKFAALQITGCGLLVALWLSGYGLIFVQADRLHAGMVIGVVVLFGLIKAWIGDWEDVRWTANLLPMLALIGTVAGLVIAVVAYATIADPEAGRTATFVAIGEALVSNMFGITGLVWLRITERVCTR